jgi:hypothetical protein
MFRHFYIKLFVFNLEDRKTWQDQKPEGMNYPQII